MRRKLKQKQNTNRYSHILLLSYFESVFGALCLFIDVQSLLSLTVGFKCKFSHSCSVFTEDKWNFYEKDSNFLDVCYWKLYTGIVRIKWVGERSIVFPHTRHVIWNLFWPEQIFVLWTRTHVSIRKNINFTGDFNTMIKGSFGRKPKNSSKIHCHSAKLLQLFRLNSLLKIECLSMEKEKRKKLTDFRCYCMTLFISRVTLCTGNVKKAWRIINVDGNILNNLLFFLLFFSFSLELLLIL